MVSPAMDKVFLGDEIEMKKAHPCGSLRWVVIRTGADIKIRCLGCGHIVMLDRDSFFKRCKKLIARVPERSDNLGTEVTERS